MKIGIDIDGVLVDMERFMADYGSKFCFENNLSVNINIGEYEEKKAFNWTEEHTEKFWNMYLEYYATKYPAREFASEILKKLKQDGHELYIVTARNEEGLPKEIYGKMKEFVKQWLEDNDIIYDRIIYTQGSKLPYCVGNYLDIMIEDCEQNIREISQKINVLCYDCNYNRNVEGKNITRVYSWYDIYQKISKN